MEIIERSEAIKLGLNKYYTGRPCKHGHLSERWAKNRVCIECHAEYRAANIDEDRKRAREYARKNKDVIAEKTRQKRLDNIDEHRKKDKEYYQKNKNKISKRHKIYYQKNKEKLRVASKTWKVKNRDSIREYKNNRYKNDIAYKIETNLRNGLIKAIKRDGVEKKKRTNEFLGCNIDVVLCHIEKKFLAGMTWANHGEWHIDHIRPCASFDLTDPEQQKECFHYTNLQPLWANDNISKNAKYDGYDYRLNKKIEDVDNPAEVE